MDLSSIAGPWSLAPPERFSFPAVPDSPDGPQAPEVPGVVWPECNDTETVWACAETADKILRQLSGRAEVPFDSLDRPAVVAITSPGDGDGKTSLLLNLAPHLARRMADGILAVDANFRKPDLTARLRLPADKTTTRPLLIYPTNLRRLNVLPASAGESLASGCGEWASPSCSGPTTGKAARHTTMQTSLAPWIEELREGWPLVLLDMCSLAHAEAAPLAGCCDGVYLAVRLGHTARRAVAQAARVLRASGARLLGCLVVE
jgi:polysaccharide biosynthesis transport protein